ncbi:FtsX-like permease family protein [Oleiagrimonas sp. C23AA]|uniref:ABC transporter permease n=1 Tax=Oleiagrimonas sp. C23AA TaxID=2719047 RepID=UPI001422D524|nr:FtsX-like permease family protein [Oleiagrimonas sp. C23AA]NII12028.1 FtsX-like permease family protein [Oleiagrimonas sp. C23AA]
MRLPPMIASLRKHKLTAWLLALQVAVTCAVVCNAAFLIVQRMQRVDVPSGLTEAGLSGIMLAPLHPGSFPLDGYLADVNAVRGIAGVQSASLIDEFPLDGSESSATVCGSLKAAQALIASHSRRVPGCAQPALYAGSEHIVRTLGLKMVQGRALQMSDFVPGKPGYQTGPVATVIISQALADHLYPGKSAVGQPLYYEGGLASGKAVRVGGVAAHLQRGRLSNPADVDLGMLLPSEPDDPEVFLAIRSNALDQARVLKAATALLRKRHPDALADAYRGQTYAQIRARYFQRDTTMIGLLMAAAIGLLFVTALGIGGLANFWVGQRTRAIGIRRAVGARQRDILAYFHTENALIVGVGVVFGLLLAYALNIYLMHRYEIHRLPWIYLPIGALALWALGQLSVFHPALRASRVPPVVATRAV